MARRRRKLKRVFLILLLGLVLLAAAYYFWPNQADDSSSSQNQTSTANQPPSAQNSFLLIDLQPTVDAWAAKQNGRASIVVYDLANKQIVASLNPDRQYFATSIYKLYVAYFGYQAIAAGTHAANDSYLGGYSRIECLDAMIRDSYSPCGEKMWNELGKASLTEKLKKYGLANTSMTGLYTSAKDAAIVLQRLFERRDLTEAHTQAFLDSLKEQPATYRRGLPSGFSQSTVYNKVGWNLQIDWHDAAIVTLPNGHSYVITVFSERVGSSQIAALGRAIEARLTQ